jgi:hypothetical protein
LGGLDAAQQSFFRKAEKGICVVLPWAPRATDAQGNRNPISIDTFIYFLHNNRRSQEYPHNVACHLSSNHRIIFFPIFSIFLFFPIFPI